MQLALRTEHIPFSSLCAFFDAAEARQRAGQDIINMVMGRPDFLPAPHINEAVKKAVDDGQVHYTSNYGLLELRQEVARKLKDENGLGYAPETEIVITAGVSEWRFEYGVVGFGFLSLAVMIFGQWKPQRIALAALLFGFFRALGNVYTGFAFLKALNVPSSVYNMLPYIISLIVLAFTSKSSRAPKAEGIPYDKGQR